MSRSSNTTFLLAIALLLFRNAGRAQALLDKPVTVNATRQPLSDVLKTMERQGNFYFSYNGNVISRSRPVTINAVKKPIRLVLDELFSGNCTYKETKGHIIIHAAKGGWYTLSGYVLDATSGERVSNASVYERQQLVATLTNDQGFFKLRLRDRFPTAAITVSKEWYTDTSLVFTASGDQTYNLPVCPIMRVTMNDVVVNQHNTIEKTWLGQLFLSSGLKAQTRNITSFIAARPVQSSFVPGLGTHGRLGAQVVNKFSLNLLGGYTAGVNGVEIGGLFNINREDVHYAQVAGIFNNVGGSVSGTQVAGVGNSVADSVSGVQVAGVANHIKGKMEGVQVAGVLNYTSGDTKGLQVSGVCNYTRKLRGMQIGIINIADSSDGYSLGFINIIRNGYHKVSVSSNEVTHFNIAVKTGNARLYTLLLGGMNFGDQHKAISFGMGFGQETALYKGLSLTTELTVQHLYLGEWDYSHLLYKVQPSLSYKLHPLASIFAGPSLNLYHSKKSVPVPGFKQDIAGGRMAGFKVNNTTQGWVGWQAGVTIF